ncbi:ectin-like [Orbicella faveolata]|uniref:ectin-like n=3 Tax=Orbicella faveolata TaxID=48498 RepID=UPI0009E5252E|nr:ectin-like [Orbicella faveolata]
METEAEWNFINSEMQQITLPGVNEWHIGLKNQGTWQWVSGKPLTIDKWQRYEPSGDGNVAVMSKDYPPGSKGLFNDLNGLYPKPFICEMPSGAKPPAPPGATAVPPGETTLPLGSTTVPSGTTTMPQGSTVLPSGSPPTPAGGGGGGGTEGMTGFEKDCLEAHNEYRAKHGVPPLKWNAQLKADAQEWANHLADINNMEHDYESINKGSGENLAYFQPGDPNNMPTQCQGPKNPSCVQCREMVADWYSEESNFDYNTGKSKGGVILHFTQVVWKETTELGMATATSANKWFSVARYKKRGNMGDSEAFKKNVPRPQ